jgi:hypothetical protein
MVTKVAAHIPGAKYVEARSGHFMAVETPDLFVELAGAVPDGRCGGGEVIVAVPDAE